MTEDLLPPTPLEASARELGADTTRYAFDYLMLPMRDGVRLATIVIRPLADGRHPALLVRSPYPHAPLDWFGGLLKALFEKDYVVVLQNERGSEWSEGEFGFLAGTTADGQDTLDRIAGQEWSNGRVGMHGCSSTAENQLKLAAIGHPALRACVPMSSGAGIGDIPGAEGGQGLFYRGGVPMLEPGRCGTAPTASAAGRSCPPSPTTPSSTGSCGATPPARRTSATPATRRRSRSPYARRRAARYCAAWAGR